VADGVIDKAGAWFSYKDIRIGQGRENAKAFLRENPDLFAEIRSEVLKRHIAAAAALAGAAGAKATGGGSGGTSSQRAIDEEE